MGKISFKRVNVRDSREPRPAEQREAAVHEGDDGGEDGGAAKHCFDPWNSSKSEHRVRDAHDIPKLTERL
jgi:hypothetical protein